MKKFSIFLFLFSLGAKGLFADANTTLTAAEYFIDVDPGEGSGTALQAADGAFDSEVEKVAPATLNASTLSVGPHLIGIRFKDDNNTWGEVLYQTIHVYDPNPTSVGGGGGGAGGFATLTAAEYFIGVDPGEGAGTPFQAKDGAFDSEVESVLPKNLDVTGLAIGPHLVGVRFKDDDNTWGEVLYQTIHVYDPNPAVGGGGGGAGGFAVVTGAEYFIGTDPGEGNATPLRPKDGAFDSEVESTLPTGLSLAGYPVGTYLVGVRYRDNANTWGEVLYKTIEVDVDTDGDGLADKAELFHETNGSVADTDGDGYLDGEEVAFGSDPKDANSLGNRSPLGLDFTGAAGIPENAPYGTVVGDFNSTDTDPNAILRFALVGGEGSTHNGLFSIHANGSLMTAAQLDYETNATLLVRVAALDEHNYSFVRKFSFGVIDVFEDLDQDGIPDHLDDDVDGDGFSNDLEVSSGSDPHDSTPSQTVDENPANPGTNGQLANNPGNQATGFLPICRTDHPHDPVNGKWNLVGKILTDGGSAVSESGFMISPRITFHNAIRLTAQPGQEPGGFTAQLGVNQLEPGKLYYFRAYALNGVGYGTGSIKKFRNPEQASNAWWAQMPPPGGGWRTSGWFGTFRRHPGTEWIYHARLGWAYALTDGQQGLWLWMRDEGWLWTQPGIHPYLFRHRSGSWLYLMGATGGKPVFFDFSIGLPR